MKIKFNVRILCAVVSILFLFACGGGGGGSGANTDTGSGGTGPAITVLEGTFIDSPVEGLKYETNTQTGITDSNGTFRYQEGETIEFYLGDIFIGDSIAKTIITPIDLVDGATDETHPTVTNICRLLQSLDYDGDLNNGIQITLQIRNEIEGRLIDFNLSTFEFETYTDVVAIFVTLNAIGAFSDGNFRTLRTAEQAQTHLRQTIGTDDGSHDGRHDGAELIHIGQDVVSKNGVIEKGDSVCYAAYLDSDLRIGAAVAYSSSDVHVRIYSPDGSLLAENTRYNKYTPPLTTTKQSGTHYFCLTAFDGSRTSYYVGFSALSY